jgi:hypothetical protein
MSFSSQLRSLFLKCLAREKAPAGLRRRPARARCVPRLEALEDRTQPSTFTVKNLNDSGTGSLRAGILSGDSTIAFANGLHGTITLTSGELSITNSVTIDGPGANKLTVSGDNASRVFDISGSASATIDGLTISDGLATVGGGILLEGNASLSIGNCTLTNNEAVGNAAGGGFGGGIEDTSPGALTVTNSTFGTNKAIGIGPNGIPSLPGNIPGSVFAFGGAIDVSFLNTGSATISNSTFTGNQALGDSPGASAGGGALSNTSYFGATMTVTDCTLCDNAAIGAAGGDGETNFGSGQGGGINNFGSLIVSNSTLTGNLAQGTPLAPGAVPSQTVSDGSASAGGGIFCLTTDTAATATITDSALSGNQAVGGPGAAGSAGSIGEGGGISVIAAEALVTDSTLSDNVAHGGAGGSGGVGAPGVSGGIDMAFGSSVTVGNTIFIDNQAIGGAGGSGASGGEGVGGGINDGTGVIYGAPDNCSLTLTGSIFIGNQAVGGAGGSGSSGGNGFGGGLSVLAGSTASIETTSVIANFALGGLHGMGGASGQGIGGGLYIDTGAGVALSNPGEVFLNYASTSNDDIFGIYTS